MKTSHLLSFLALAIGLAMPVAAQHGHGSEHAHGAHTPEPTAARLARLREGGLVLFVRHERTDGTARDDADYALGDCTTQRNLSAAGVASAKEIGENLRTLDVPIGIVLASPMCRTLETARTMFGEAQAKDALHGDGRDGAAIGADLRQLAEEHAASGDGTNAVLVAHIANLEHAFGTRVHEGDAAVIAMEGGEPRIVGTIPANAWNDMVIDALRHHGPSEGHADEAEPLQTE